MSMDPGVLAASSLIPPDNLTHSAMSPSRPSERVSLPSIHEMFPEHLLALPPRGEYRALAPTASNPPPLHPILPLAGGRPGPPVDPLPASPQMSPGPRPETLAATRRGSQADEERRHACPTCGKAFNRPSSLAIHVNTHTGARPFECPFPGCGRRFNVNSNMRRHHRNHSSPARPFNSGSPYTYPLTTIPRALYSFAGSLNCGTPARPPTLHPAQYRSSDSGSEEDELSESDHWEPERDHELAEGVDRLRLRAYSTSSAASSPRVHPTGQPHRRRANSCATPDCRECRRTAAPHPPS
ncbi:uncharacterized protein PHACADRAFT_135949 [Phanerochaete carnosa HHB-10118-sp]|uniref:C2H2-type domain-containing protein n=1 Tax=Phanerochaete carnosa (strain HHB-10118-sp) TaxID=650164 RepID=K5W4L6_PHACS|nr:uncharacterized protein PHACADRAFT_135949 [Phanerochaete carnosa HHB-10118-sp]EKM58818.1 hypothetical protein PHACADRAFT_135949 [Phanerochaete carnosa HHB-10118-sp]